MKTTAARCSIQGSIRKYALWLAVLPLLAGTFAQAQPTTLDLQLWNGSTSMGYWDPAIVSTGTGYSVNNVTYGGGASPYTLSLYNTTVGYDPFISSSVDVVNNTSSTQTYTLLYVLPISPAITGGTRIGGSVQGGVTDANNDGIGILSTLSGAPMFYGQVDGNNVLPLFSSPTTIMAPYAGGSASSSANAGLPGATIAGPGSALTSIGIEYQFTLTAGDRATFTGFFEVLPVPEPGSLSLLAVGWLMLVCRSRR